MSLAGDMMEIVITDKCKKMAKLLKPIGVDPKQDMIVVTSDGYVDAYSNNTGEKLYSKSGYPDLIYSVIGHILNCKTCKKEYSLLLHRLNAVCHKLDEFYR